MVDYRIKFDSETERTYHINMLKKFISRSVEGSICQDDQKEQNDHESDDNL